MRAIVQYSEDLVQSAERRGSVAGILVWLLNLVVVNAEMLESNDVLPCFAKRFW